MEFMGSVGIHRQPSPHALHMGQGRPPRSRERLCSVPKLLQPCAVLLPIFRGFQALHSQLCLPLPLCPQVRCGRGPGGPFGCKEALVLAGGLPWAGRWVPGQLDGALSLSVCCSQPHVDAVRPACRHAARSCQRLRQMQGAARGAGELHAPAGNEPAACTGRLPTTAWR